MNTRSPSLEEAIEVLVKEQQEIGKAVIDCPISLLQRRLRLSYTPTVELMNELKKNGLVLAVNESAVQLHNSEFFTNGIAAVKITDWLDWAIGKQQGGASWRIVLPMIQRGSVWKPHQVMDLWDTLLRGMPLGSMMASMVRGNDTKYFHPITRELLSLPPEGGLSLLDGQQRTLSMLLAWPAIGNDMNRRVWIDLGREASHDHLFCFHFSTENHYFGFELARESGSPVAKLPVAERKAALAAYAPEYQRDDGPVPAPERRQALWSSAEVQPWRGVFPVNLQKVIEAFRQSTDKNVFVAEITKCLDKRITWLTRRIEELAATNKDNAATQRARHHLDSQLKQLNEFRVAETKLTRTERLYEALKVFFSQHMPVIEVPDRIFSQQKGAEERDPALAVLFKRVGTGGTDLKDADYVYSVIKHRNPACHSLVESLVRDERIAALFTPVTLVTAAVRLTAAKLGLNDYSRIRKAEFARLLRDDRFLKAFNEGIEKNGLFAQCLKALLDTLSYLGKDDIGLPKHALCLLELPVLEALLCWLQKEPSHNVARATETNRRQLIRFVLFCALAVKDPHKASARIFKELTSMPLGEFPEDQLVTSLVGEQLALPMHSPVYFASHPVLQNMVNTPHAIERLRGWRRFSLADLAPNAEYQEDERRTLEQAIELYRRFWNRRQRWNYRHELLLWLQRNYLKDFEEMPALPGAEDETPYDFDHICPQSHWRDWRGRGKNARVPTRIIDFLERENEQDDQPQSWLGDSIGNVRVWDSSDNRSDGDGTPKKKLKIEAESISAEASECLKESGINEKDIGLWRDCSCAPEHAEDPTYWTKERTLAFQSAVENRVFDLYERLYDHLGPWPNSYSYAKPLPT